MLSMSAAPGARQSDSHPTHPPCTPPARYDAWLTKARDTQSLFPLIIMSINNIYPLLWRLCSHFLRPLCGALTLRLCRSRSSPPASPACSTVSSCCRSCSRLPSARSSRHSRHLPCCFPCPHPPCIPMFTYAHVHCHGSRPLLV